ncbi:MAG: type II toxin-antitoxin system HigB family toxin [Bacteroidales bacterium]|jgi:mRNA interferase HigB|nr:type II toxin-antitoxin system HigB family toxin [Bacteroidales bacterium]MDD4215195.1 type II toxin-antitoxin system HigB family toxin [Bacteroidales bacterium]
MVHIILYKHIYEFGCKHPQYAEVLKAWVSLVEDCNWEKPQDIKNDFSSTDIITKKDNKPNTKMPNRAVFDIKGNHIRIIVKYQFFKKQKKCKLYLKWIGTHAEYTKLCEKSLQYDIDSFG